MYTPAPHLGWKHQTANDWDVDCFHLEDTEAWLRCYLVFTKAGWKSYPSTLTPWGVQSNIRCGRRSRTAALILQQASFSSRSPSNECASSISGFRIMGACGMTAHPTSTILQLASSALRPAKLLTQQTFDGLDPPRTPSALRQSPGHSAMGCNTDTGTSVAPATRREIPDEIFRFTGCGEPPEAPDLFSARETRGLSPCFAPGLLGPNLRRLPRYSARLPASLIT